jgi:cytidine deaminase
MPASPSATDLARLIEEARRASGQAYAPYSRFRVGAAVLTEGGDIFSGCNVENASYGLTICAERNAVFQAVAAGRREVVAVVVYTPTLNPTAPCGACRQVLNEFGPGALVVCVCDGPESIRTALSELLPQAFGPKNLGTDSAPPPADPRVTPSEP